MSYNSKKEDGLDNPVFVTSPDDPENGVSQGKKLSIKENEEESERSQWGNGVEFLMSCIAMSVGLGNIWRFPFIAQANGGGAFLIPYIIILTIIGRPMYYMEMSLGQFSSRGCAKMYQKMSPVFRGIGIGQVIGSSCVASYYCVLMAITLFYLFNSFTSNFPWMSCQDSWTDYLNSRNLDCIGVNTNLSSGNNTISSSEMYFRREVLKESDDISDGIGPPDWRLTLLLLLSWTITYLVSVKGVRSSGKASYFLAIFPYVIMITLLIRASTLEGASEGMKYFIETDWARLLDANVWYAAITQCFFSLNVGFGNIVTLSSYNKFDHNINRDAFIITSLDTCTSLLSGLTIFGILGNLAHEMKVSPKDVVSSGGAGLAFISYPDALSKFTFAPWLFAITFFFMLFVLGVGSLAALHANLNTLIKDNFPTIPDWIIAAVTATGLFLIGLIYVTPGGQYTLDLVDHFGGTFLIFVCAILEVIAICWIYGIDNFCKDIEFMTKKKVGIYWRMCWGLLVPQILVLVFFYFVATLKPMTYGVYNLYYPVGLEVLGWGILAVGSLQVLGWIIYYLYVNRDSSIAKTVAKTFSTATWGPDSQKNTDEWRKFKEDILAQSPPKTGPWICQKLKLLIGR